MAGTIRDRLFFFFPHFIVSHLPDTLQSVWDLVPVFGAVDWAASHDK